MRYSIFGNHVVLCRLSTCFFGGYSILCVQCPRRLVGSQPHHYGRHIRDVCNVHFLFITPAAVTLAGEQATVAPVVMAGEEVKFARCSTICLSRG